MSHSKDKLSQKSLPTLLGFAISTCIAFGLQAMTPVAAADQLYTISIEATPLGEALLNIARQSGERISFDPDLVRTYRSAPVNGNLSIEQALRAALRDTDLSLERAPNGSYTVSRKAAPASDASSSNNTSNSTLLKPLIVQGERVKTAYVTDSTRSATRTDTPLLELSQSVSSVSRELLDDQQALSVLDALRNVSSVSSDDSSPGPGGSVNVRGFTVENAMTDGLPSSGSFAFQTPTIGLERIDVIKGPESVIGGTTATFGGAVNLVTKRPQAEVVRQLQATLDSEGRRQLGLDVTGALTESEELRGRLVMSGDELGNTELGLNGGRNYYIAPSLGWKDDTNNLVVGFEAQNQREALGDYVYFTGTHINGDYLPTYHAKDDAIEYQRRRTYFDYQRDLGNAWELGLRGQYLEQESSGDYWLQNTANIPIGNAPVTVQAVNQGLSYRDQSVQADIAKQLSLGFTEHRLMLGFDYLKSQTDQAIRLRYDTDIMGTYPGGTTGVLPSVDSLPNSLPLFAIESGFTERGVFMQDQITLWDKLHVKLALRRISYEPGFNSTNPSLSKNMPSAGIAYQYSPTGSVYASYSEGVGRPPALLTRTGTPLPPSEATQREAGIKNTFFDDKLVLTTALFDIQKTNVAEPDFDNPTTYHVIGGARSRGLEVEVNGRITPALSLSTAYTYTKATSDSGDNNGAVPQHAINVWGLYRFQNDWRGWNVGGGIVARSETYANYGSYNLTSRNPGNARIDLTGGYETPDWSVRLGIRNLADRTMFSPTSTLSYAALEPGRTATLSGTLNF